MLTSSTEQHSVTGDMDIGVGGASNNRITIIITTCHGVMTPCQQLIVPEKLFSVDVVH